MSILRAVLGATFGATRAIPITPPDPDKPPRLDPEVRLVATSDDEWTVTVEVDPYSLADCNLLVETRAYLINEGHGLPSDAQGFMESSYPYASVDMSGSPEGTRIILPLPEVSPGKFYGQLVNLYDDSASPPPPPSEDGPAPSEDVSDPESPEPEPG